MSTESEVTETYRVLGHVLLDGEVCPITNMFDHSREPTEDHGRAEIAVVKKPNGKWAVVDLRLFELTSVQ